MGKKRTGADLDIYLGDVRSFEWLWEARGEMHALDAELGLTENRQQRADWNDAFAMHGHDDEARIT